MIYCFDIDGTISEKPNVFRSMMEALVKAGHTVYPLTGMVYSSTPFPPEDYEQFREKQMTSFGFEKGRDYQDIVIVCGNSPQDCGELKGKFCKEQGVHFMVEDTGIYAESIKRHSPETLCLRMPNGLN